MRRKIDRRTFLAGLGATGAAAAIAACAPGTSPTVPSASAAASAAASATPAGVKPLRGGKATLAVQREANELDGEMASTGQAVMYSRLFYNQLWRASMTSTGFKAEPELAESWELTNPTTLVFHLRKGVQFHDGSEFDATVAQWNFERVAKAGSKSPGMSRIIAAVKSAQVIDKYTFQFNLVAPSPYLFENGLGFTHYWWMMSPAYYDKVGDTGFARSPMGTGPFKLAEWVQGDHLTATRFDNYWDKDSFGVQRPYLDQVTFKPIADTTALFNALRSGSVDWVVTLLPTDVAIAKKDPTLKVTDDPGIIQNFSFNTKTPALADKRVRQAIAWAIDREAIAQGVYLGLGAVPKWYMPDGDAWNDASVPYYTFDQAKAKSLLAATAPNGLKFTLTVDNVTQMTQLAQVIKAQLKDVGIDVTLDVVQPGVASQRGQNGQVESSLFAVGGGTAPATPDDVTFDPVRGQYTFTPDLLAKAYPVLQQARQESDRGKAKQLYAQFWTLDFDDPGRVNLHRVPDIRAMNKQLMGYHQQGFFGNDPMLDQLWWQK